MQGLLQMLPGKARRGLLRFAFLLMPLALVVISGSVFAQTQPSDSAPQGNLIDQTPVFLPIVHQDTYDHNSPGTRGSLTLGGIPFANATVTLRYCRNDIPAEEPVYTVTTDGFGRYFVPILGKPGDTPTHYVSMTLAFSITQPVTVSVSPTKSVEALGSFNSNCAHVGSSYFRKIPTIDLEAPVFELPPVGVPTDMPIHFTWRGRSEPAQNETLQWHGLAQFDCGDCAPVEIESTTLISTAVSLEWCAIEPHPSGVQDVLWVDYTLKVANSIGHGETLPRRALVGTTLHECPPLPENESVARTQHR